MASLRYGPGLNRSHPLREKEAVAILLNQMKQLLFWSLVLATQLLHAQHHYLYHQYESTASDYQITKWNVRSDSLPVNYIREGVDEKERVIDVQFFQNHSLNYDIHCGLVPWLHYEYPNDTTIIEFGLNADSSKSSSIDCGGDWKTTFYLSGDKQKILRVEYEYFIDTVEWLTSGHNLQEIDKLYLFLKEEENRRIPELFVYGYVKSKAKLGGLFPIGGEFVETFNRLGNSYFGFSDAELVEILKAVKTLKEPRD